MGSRRGKGEGSIYQRASDGKWVGMIDLGYGPDGKRKRKPIYGKTRKEVADKMKTTLHEQQQGTLPISTERQTLAKYLEKWLQDTVKPTVRPRTYESYSALVRVHISPSLGRIQLTKLSAQDIQGFMNAKLDAGLSPRTVTYCRAILRRALGQALKWGLIARNVATLVDPPRSRHGEMRTFSVTEARAFLTAVKGNRLEALYTVAMSLGLRRGEALGLRWEDVDLENCTLTVRVALQRVGGKLQLSETKTDRSRRTISLPQITVAALRAHKVRQLEERLQMGSRWQESGLVFPSAVGTPMEPRNMVRSFKAILQRAELPDIRFHDLRHTAASLLLAQGVHARVIMDTLGHSSISLTMNLYSHVMPEAQRQVAQQMDALLGDAG